MMKHDKSKGKVSLLTFLGIINKHDTNVKIYDSKRADYFITLHKVLDSISNKIGIHLYDNIASLKFISIKSNKMLEFKYNLKSIPSNKIIHIKDLCNTCKEVDLCKINSSKNGDVLTILISKKKPVKILHDKYHIKK